MKNVMLRAIMSAACAVAVASTPVSVDATASAAPGARLVSRTQTDRVADISVYSPAMDRTIALRVLRPSDTSTPAPTLYLLNGAGGGEDSANWPGQTDAGGFFADKHVNVVVPMEGAFSYYTDWRRPDAGLAKNLENNGNNMWTTFLTQELPPVIDAAFGTNGDNSLAGISMAGTSVLDLAIQAPELYRSVSAYSGCAMTSDPIGRAFVSLVVRMGGGNTENMWGPDNDAAWREHDPYVQAHRLPNIPIYISAGTGLPGPHDTLSNPRVHISGKNPTSILTNQMLVGGGIEAATAYCTANLAQRTRGLGRTNITYNIRPTGTHSWGYWEDDLHASWPMMATALGLP
ncbi:alpha/beta hydrolase family protein [Nocardia sp. PE-7]|uniref:alpha/beta hydrolase n=1 Tax=Nocardia sp. PE-7 TaxID=3058426 RepID=UPI00265A1CFD|nr:alpha/beta hydrolase family protein [Nocardia sp. PE-7]WKG07269.1 alpha/beta hydrolase family protein [Nocardia sp. PE-7]